MSSEEVEEEAETIPADLCRANTVVVLQVEAMVEEGENEEEGATRDVYAAVCLAV